MIGTSFPTTNFLSSISARNIAALVAAALLVLVVGVTFVIQSAHADSVHVDNSVNVKQNCHNKDGIQTCTVTLFL